MQHYLSVINLVYYVLLIDHLEGFFQFKGKPSESNKNVVKNLIDTKNNIMFIQKNFMYKIFFSF